MGEDALKRQATLSTDKTGGVDNLSGYKINKISDNDKTLLKRIIRIVSFCASYQFYTILLSIAYWP